MSTITQAAADVLAERQRQISTEGWTPEHDDEHGAGQLAAAAGCYALFSDAYPFAKQCPAEWPWDAAWWKPSDYRRDLVKAGALILAEIERLDRAAGASTPAQISPASELTGQILVMATLLERALGVVKNVEAEGCDEGEQLQQLIADGEAAIATVLQQHAMPQTAAVSADPPDHPPV